MPWCQRLHMCYILSLHNAHAELQSSNCNRLRNDSIVRVTHLLGYLTMLSLWQIFNMGRKYCNTALNSLNTCQHSQDRSLVRSRICRPQSDLPRTRCERHGGVRLGYPRNKVAGKVIDPLGETTTDPDKSSILIIIPCISTIAKPVSINNNVWYVIF